MILAKWFDFIIVQMKIIMRIYKVFEKLEQNIDNQFEILYQK